MFQRRSTCRCSQLPLCPEYTHHHNQKGAGAFMVNEWEATRREFLRTSAKSGAGLAALGGISFIAQPEKVFGANDRVRVAVVGLHGQGWSHVEEYSRLS